MIALPRTFAEGRARYEEWLLKCLRTGVCLYCGDPASAHDVEPTQALFPVIYRVAQQHAVTPDVPICAECHRATSGTVMTTAGQKRGVAMHRNFGRHRVSPTSWSIWAMD